MSLGVVSFLADVSEWQDDCYFWKFDEIVVKSATDAAEKIHALEVGKRDYPWGRFEDLACLSKEYYVDCIKRHLATVNCDSLEPIQLERVS